MIGMLEWGGSLTGLVGAYLLATNTPMSRYGWYFYLVANVATTMFAIGIDRYGLLVQQIGFCATSLYGIYRSRPSTLAEDHFIDENQKA